MSTLAFGQSADDLKSCPIRITYEPERAAGPQWELRTSVTAINMPNQPSLRTSGIFGDVFQLFAHPGKYVFTVTAREFQTRIGVFDHECINGKPKITSRTFQVARVPVRMKKAMVRLPFTDRPQEISYYLRNGNAIAFGDMILGKESDVLASATKPVPAPAPPPSSRAMKPLASSPARDGLITIRQPLLFIRDETKRWPGGRVPFLIPNGIFNEAERAHVLRGMSELLHPTTSVHFVEATPNDLNMIVFEKTRLPDGIAGNSDVGMVGGSQQINLDAIALANSVKTGSTRVVVHEIMHALGFYHEHQRPDASDHVQIDLEKVKEEGIDPETIETNYAALDKGLDGSVPYYEVSGPYDYESIMHYRSSLFKCVNNCNGKRIGGVKLSEGDRKGLSLLYPGPVSLVGGDQLPAGTSPNGFAFGDLNGDGNPEFLVSLDEKKNGNPRIVIHDSSRQYDEIDLEFEFGKSWGPNAHATSIAAGDVDERLGLDRSGPLASPRIDEFVVTRKTTVNARVIVYQPYRVPFDRMRVRELFSTGAEWDPSIFARQAVIADLDEDGMNEIIVITNDIVRGIPLKRFPGALVVYRYDRALKTFKIAYASWQSLIPQLKPGTSAGSDVQTTFTRVHVGPAFGGYLPYVLVTTGSKTQDEARYLYLRPKKGERDRAGTFELAHAGGHTWGDNYFATDITSGRTDESSCNMPSVFVSRYALENSRVVKITYSPGSPQNSRLLEASTPLGSEYRTWVERLAMGDIRQDLHSEVYFSRRNADRFFAGYRLGGYQSEPVGYRRLHDIPGNMIELPLEDDEHVTAIETGQADEDEALELAVGMNSTNWVLSGGRGNSASGTTPNAFRYILYNFNTEKVLARSNEAGTPETDGAVRTYKSVSDCICEIRRICK